MQNGFPNKLPVEELARYLANLGPGGFHTNRRLELASGDQASQMRQPDRGRFLCYRCSENELGIQDWRR